MIHKYAWIILSLGLLGCASHPENKNDDLSASEEERTTNEAQGPSPVEKSESRTAAPKVSSGSSLSQAKSSLAEALKSQNDEAIFRAATAVLAQNSKDQKAQSALGQYHLKKQKYLAAQYFYSKILQQNPKSSDTHNNMGLVHLGLKNTKDAMLSFRKALELDPQNMSSAINLGSLYLEKHDYQKAVVPFELAVQKDPKDYRLHVNYGIALAGSGKFAAAKEQYEAALKLNSSGKEAMYNLAILEIDQMKQYKEGLDLLNKVRFLGFPDSIRARILALENKAKANLK